MRVLRKKERKGRSERGKKEKNGKKRGKRRRKKGKKRKTTIKNGYIPAKKENEKESHITKRR